MFHEGKTPGGHKVVNRFPVGKELPAQVSPAGGYAGAEPVASAMLDACGLGPLTSPDVRIEEPAAHFHSVRDLPGPSIFMN